MSLARCSNRTRLGIDLSSPIRRHTIASAKPPGLADFSFLDFRQRAFLCRDFRRSPLPLEPEMRHRILPWAHDIHRDKGAEEDEVVVMAEVDDCLRARRAPDDDCHLDREGEADRLGQDAEDEEYAADKLEPADKVGLEYREAHLRKETDGHLHVHDLPPACSDEEDADDKTKNKNTAGLLVMRVELLYESAKAQLLEVPILRAATARSTAR